MFGNGKLLMEIRTPVRAMLMKIIMTVFKGGTVGFGEKIVKSKTPP
jgi:hypothetical protein